MFTDSKKPKYRHIADMLHSQIQSGELKPGDRLPSFVKMYRDYGATETTMRRVYEVLEKEKLIERRRGSGVYVAEAKSTFTGNIGIIGDKDLYFDKMNYNHDLQCGIQAFTEQNKQHVLFLGNYTDPDLSAYEKVDGVLTLNVEYQAQRLKYLPPTMPRVSLFIKENEAANVIADEQDAAIQATQYLLKLGHRRIACLFEKYLSIPQLRLAGYQEALSKKNINIDHRWIRLTEVLFAAKQHPTYLEWGRSNMKCWLEEGWLDLGCTAILVQNDSAAIGVMQTLQEEGIDIPGQVSIIGFDGTSICDHVNPTLCSMKAPLEEMGYKAAKLLHEQIHKGVRDVQTIMLPMNLREGSSVALVSRR